jgi:hypothetical protein
LVALREREFNSMTPHCSLGLYRSFSSKSSLLVVSFKNFSSEEIYKKKTDLTMKMENFVKGKIFEIMIIILFLYVCVCILYTENVKKKNKI